MAPYFHQLPPVLEAPYYYLSRQQATVIQDRAPSLSEYLPLLPAWVPHQRVAEALGYSTEGIATALAQTFGRPYVWATEFENVHTLWRFDEPAITICNQTYRCIETYYHAQKPQPFDADTWDAERRSVMQLGLHQKFQDESLKQLLLSTRNHPLASIKPDSYWGIHPIYGGANMLGELLEETRIDLRNWATDGSAAYDNHQNRWEIVRFAIAMTSHGSNFGSFHESTAFQRHPCSGGGTGRRARLRA